MKDMSVEDLIVLYEDNHVLVVLKPQNVPCCEDESKDKDLLTVVKEYIKIKENKPVFRLQYSPVRIKNKWSNPTNSGPRKPQKTP